MWENQGNLAMAAGEKFGKTFVQIIHMKDQITGAGFVDVTEVRFKWPVGPWSNDQKMKDLGRWNMHMWEQGLEGWTMALLTRVMRVSQTPYEYTIGLRYCQGYQSSWCCRPLTASPSGHMIRSKIGSDGCVPPCSTGDSTSIKRCKCFFYPFSLIVFDRRDRRVVFARKPLSSSTSATTAQR